MKYLTEIQAGVNSPDSLEDLYQSSLQSNEEAEFQADLQEAFDKAPENLLLSAWHARFSRIPLPKVKRSTNWLLAVIIGIVTGLLLWSISDMSWHFLNHMPYFMVFWAPVATIPTMIYLAIISKKNYLYTAGVSVGLILLCVYILLLAPTQASPTSRDYLTLMVFELPLLCWIGLAIAIMRFKSAASNRYAFLVKSIEVMVTAGVYLIFGLAFGGITLGLFAALNITPSDIIIRLLYAGGIGLIAVMAVATMYDPLVSPEAQDFDQGLSKFVATMMRLLLPLTLVVLVIYIFVIPFNFFAPFQNRNLLIVYNVMQFAIIGLLIGATPLKVDNLSEKIQLWLRRGIIAVIVLTLLISLYALSAVIYRTAMDGLTLNRTTIIGWNIINIVLLVGLVLTQWRKEVSGWQERLQKVFSKATTAYLVWSLLLVVLLPLIFK